MRIELITPQSARSRMLRKWRLIQFPRLTMPLLADLIRGRSYGRAVTIATRGCVHQCAYCSIPFMYGPG